MVQHQKISRQHEPERGKSFMCGCVSSCKCVINFDCIEYLVGSRWVRVRGNWDSCRDVDQSCFAGARNNWTERAKLHFKSICVVVADISRRIYFRRARFVSIDSLFSKTALHYPHSVFNHQRPRNGRLNSGCSRIRHGHIMRWIWWRMNVRASRVNAPYGNLFLRRPFLSQKQFFLRAFHCVAMDRIISKNQFSAKHGIE